MLYKLLFQLIYHDPIRISNGGILEVIMEKNEKENLMTIYIYI